MFAEHKAADVVAGDDRFAAVAAAGGDIGGQAGELRSGDAGAQKGRLIKRIIGGGKNQFAHAKVRFDLLIVFVRAVFLCGRWSSGSGIGHNVFL